MAQTMSELTFGVSWTEGGPLVHKATLPPADDISAFLHRMRPFILQDESTHFPKIRNLLAHYLNVPAARKYLGSLRERYTGKAIGLSIRVGDIDLTAENAIHKWLYAFEYHQDEDKRAELLAMYKIFPETSARALFLCAMLQRASAIGKLGALIDGLSRRDGVAQRLRS